MVAAESFCMVRRSAGCRRGDNSRVPVALLWLCVVCCRQRERREISNMRDSASLE